MASTSTYIPEVPARSLTRRQSRSDLEAEGTEKLERSCCGLFSLLEYNKSEVLSDDQNSVMSLQNHSTDCPQETPFTSSCSSSEHQSSEPYEYEAEDQYDTESLQESIISDISTGDEPTLPNMVFSTLICDSTPEDWLTDREESDDSYVPIATRLKKMKRRYCIKCNIAHKDFLYSYCQDCYQRRKELFPPRPKGFKKRVQLDKKKKKKSTNNALSQDSGFGIPLSGNTQTENINLIRKRTSTSDDEDLESQCPKRLRTEESRTNCNNNVPVMNLNVETPEFNKEVDKTRGCDELDPSNQLSWIKKTVIREDDGEEEMVDIDEQLNSVALKNKSQLNQTSIAITKDLCMMCDTFAKDSIFLHGTTAHLACCYYCAVKAWKTTKSCPVCKAKVRNIIKIYS